MIETYKLYYLIIIQLIQKPIMMGCLENSPLFRILNINKTMRKHLKLNTNENKTVKFVERRESRASRNQFIIKMIKKNKTNGLGFYLKIEKTSKLDTKVIHAGNTEIKMQVKHVKKFNIHLQYFHKTRTRRPLIKSIYKKFTVTIIFNDTHLTLSWQNQEHSKDVNCHHLLYTAYTGGLTSTLEQDKDKNKNKNRKVRKEKVKLSIFIKDFFVCVENPKKSSSRQLLVSEF